MSPLQPTSDLFYGTTSRPPSQLALPRLSWEIPFPPARIAPGVPRQWGQNSLPFAAVAVIFV